VSINVGDRLAALISLAEARFAHESAAQDFLRDRRSEAFPLACVLNARATGTEPLCIR
jgi:hypothetical protein